MLNRRNFLKMQMKGAGLAMAAGSGLLLPKAGLTEAVPDIAVTKGAKIAGVRKAVEMLGGMSRFVKKGNRVLIKPNMSFARGPEYATTTHPEVVREVVIMCMEAGAASVRVLDHPLAPADRCLARTGIKDILKPIDKNMVHMVESDHLYSEVKIPDGLAITKMDIMKEVLKSDVLIAVPVAKSHSSTGVSLSMKGMMGLIYNRRVLHWMYDLDDSIVDMNTVLKADLVIIDGSRVLTTNGPGGPGKVVVKNTIIASTDCVAADAYAVSAFEWYGKKFKPRQVAHIREAHERDLGRMDIENLSIKTVTV